MTAAEDRSVLQLPAPGPDRELRYGDHPDAVAAGIVDSAVAEDAVRSTALDLAAAQAGKAGATLATIKARLYGPVLDLLRDRTDPRG